MNNKKKAVLLRENYRQWKRYSLDNKGFFVVFNGFLEEKKLKDISGGALKLYIFLGIKSDNITGESFYTVRQIAQYFSASERTVSNWIKELEKMNLIIRLQFKYNGVTHTFLNPYGTLKSRGLDGNEMF